MREDPEMHEKAKKKERERYLKRKIEGKLVSIKVKTPREQRRQRKRWRENMRNHRVKKEKILQTGILLMENLPTSSIENSQVDTHIEGSSKKKNERNKVNTNRRAANMKIKELEDALCHSKRGRQVQETLSLITTKILWK